MNFFDHQASARRQSRLIIFGFIGVTILIVIAVDLVVMAVMSVPTGAPAFLSTQNVTGNLNALLAASGGTAGIISLSSMGKIASLRSGGGKVAKGMGGTLVSPDVRDPLRRRYYNVVEEIAIASGVPVPEVYVMEDEPAINAFAAGYSSSDAAVAVTQGALEKLNRAELQGVIAHEFSHIFNGDMRLNIRMMGVLFGILIAAVIGRKLISSSRFIGRGGSRESNGAIAGVLAAGAVLMIVGYVGLFFARMMKSALSRQREYLADASAVQFTRDPDGIAGALKKLGAYSHHSYLQSDSEEVSHMLFGMGKRSNLFATHPPIVERIQRIQPSFKEAELTELAKKLRSDEHREHLQAAEAEKELAEKKTEKKAGGMIDIGNMLDHIGNPGMEQILGAAIVAASIPNELTTAAHSIQWAPEVLLYCLLDSDPAIREEQLLIITKHRGDIGMEKVSFLINLNKTLSPEQRLPLMEISFPALKQRPVVDIEKLIETVDQLVHIDKKVDTFEYLLARQIKLHLREAKNPGSVVAYGRKKIPDLADEVSLVLSILARHGHDNPQDIVKAYQHGTKAAGISTGYQSLTDWHEQLDAALDKLNELKLEQKKTLVTALAAVVTSDGKLVAAEHEMLRAICATIHVPLPVLNKAA